MVLCARLGFFVLVLANMKNLGVFITITTCLDENRNQNLYCCTKRELCRKCGSRLLRSSSSECTIEDFGKIKRNCRRSGLNFDMAETVDNRTLVCDCLQQLFRCIDQYVPNCVDTMEEKYVDFRYTPWDCHVTEYHPSGNNTCGDNVVFEIKLKKEPDQTVVIFAEDDLDLDTPKSSASNNIALFADTFYILSVTLCMKRWTLTRT